MKNRKELKVMDTKTVREQTIRDSIYSSAIHGIIVWTVYAVVECLFACILPWIINPNYNYEPLHWGFTVLLFVIYPAIGSILGGVYGIVFHLAVGRIRFLQRIKATTLFQVAATVTVVFVFGINLIVQYPISDFSILLSLLVSFLLTIMLVLRTTSIIWIDRICFVTNPWTTCIALLGPLWLIKDALFGYSFIIKTGSVLAYLVAVLIFSFVIQKVVETRRILKSTKTVSVSLKGPIFWLAFIVFIVLGLSFFLEQTPLREDSKLPLSHPKQDAPNIILITIDTVRADHMSLYGYQRETTPKLRELAKNATLYTRAISAGDMTLPSHSSIFTGMYARQHGAHYDPWNGNPEGRPLSDKFQTIAEILSEAGYLTKGVVANIAYLTSDFGFNQGFQYYDQRMPVIFFGKTGPFYIRQIIRNTLLRFASTSTFDRKYRTAKKINSEVFKILDDVRKGSRPNFLLINYMDAHEPYYPPSPFDRQYPGKDEMFCSSYYHTMEKEVMQLKRNVTDKERDHLISQYDGGIAYIDFHIGKLIERLKELGLYKNSLIIITSDHGDSFGERNLVGHGVSVYQDQIYIPLIVKYPNIKKKEVVDEIVSSVDIMPTILELLTYKTPDNLQGISLQKLESGKTREVISESFPYGGWLEWHSRFDRVERAIFSGPYKFISSTAGKKELYNLLQDSSEKDILNKTENKITMDLEAKLNRWLETTVPRFESTSKKGLNKDTLERLKALGYVQ